MRPKICYAAIFRNESKNVYRCLNSLKSIIDYVSICDTGSTDNTIELITQWGKENDIPTTVHSGPEQIFKNFGYNRTLSYKKAIESYPQANYLLFIDADMIVRTNDNWKNDKLLLTAHSYLFEQVNPSIRYWNVRLVSTKIFWKCTGVTHEYWDSDGDKNQLKLSSIWIDDIGDGGSKENKFKRDIRLLTDGINDPDERGDVKTRYKFYLANSYKDTNNNLEAIRWYDERIKDGGFREEIYMSHVYKGKCFKRLEDIPSAINSYLKAWDILPIRSESLYRISKIYRKQGNNNLAMLFSEKGLKIPYPKECVLFINHKIYEYLFLEEISISGYYCGVDGQNKGKACIIKLLSMKDKLPKKRYDLALANAAFYGITPELIDKLKL